ncbi:unnamed protein product, partial [marine sediment metagenome]
KLVLPGFVNAHDHLDGSLLDKGHIMAYPLVEYLKKIKWPRLRVMTENDFHLGALLGEDDMDTCSFTSWNIFPS